MKLFLIIFILTNCVILSVSRPNIIIIVADDLGWNDVSFHGSGQIPTPNLDSLAADGIILNNYYVQPICTPSRSALMTGMHPIRTGMQEGVISGGEPYGLPLKFKLLPEYLNDLGYRSHMIGKWHLGFFKKEYTPLYRGFRSHFGYWCGQQDYYDHTAAESGFWGYDMRSNMSVSKQSFGLYSTDIFNRNAVKIIEGHDNGRPLFLYLAHLAVHSANAYDPLQAPKKYTGRFPWIKDRNRRTFAGMLSALDDGVGDVVKALHKRGMLKDSIIVFTTDNGGPAAGFDMNHASNWPLRGVKNTLWEGGVRGTGFIWSTHLNATSRISTQLMKIEDWLPTLHSAAGGGKLNLGPLGGVDMWKKLKYNLASEQNEVLHNIDLKHKTSAIRIGKYKLVQGSNHLGKWNGWYGPSGRNISEDIARKRMKNSPTFHILKSNLNRTFSLKIAEISCQNKPLIKNCFPRHRPCLFDIKADPCEYNNLAPRLKETVKKMMARIAEYQKIAVKPANKVIDPDANPYFHKGNWVPWRSL